MRIEFATEGGVAYFPGLSRPVVLDTGELDGAEAERVERLVAAAGFFQLPAEASAPRAGAADYQRYTVTIDDGERRHRVRFADPIGDPDQLALIDALKSLTRKRRSDQEPNDGGGD